MEPDGSVDERLSVFNGTDDLELGFQQPAQDVKKGNVIVCQQNGRSFQFLLR
jgi:hypothetical protein